MKEALENIRVIDLCRSYPPAFAAAIMGDFGADVIKIDVPGFSLPLPMLQRPDSLAFWFFDKNKRALSLNLKSEQGREIFFKLARQTDVIIENSMPGTMDGLGIGYSTIKEINSRIVYCSVSGYGQDGPYSQLPGHDSNYLSIAGALSLFGQKNGPPIMSSGIIADMAGGAMHSLAAVLIALLAREKTGEGQFIDVSYTDGVFSLLAVPAALYLLTGISPRRGEHMLTGSEPFLSNYKTKDGQYFNIACFEPRLWENLCHALRCEEFIPDQWTLDKRKKEKMFSFFEKTFLTKTRDEWWEWAKDKGIAVAPVLHLEEAFNDPQILHRLMIHEVEHPTLGKIKQLGTPFKLSETPARQKGFSPTPGQHTDQILRELGYADQDIKDFKERGAVGG